MLKIAAEAVVTLRYIQFCVKNDALQSLYNSQLYEKDVKKRRIVCVSVVMFGCM